MHKFKADVYLRLLILCWIQNIVFLNTTLHSKSAFG